MVCCTFLGGHAHSSTSRCSSAHYRSEIAALKRNVSALEKGIKGVVKSIPKSAQLTGQDGRSKLRFRADEFKVKRETLGLTAEGAGKFFNVSGQTIYLWESKRASQMPAIAAFRKLGKRQAQPILATLV
jgi:DNA-binding XRE family transcriptional regulator